MIPGWFISIATFPGVIIHEWAHKKFCDWTGVAVHKVIYFRFGNPAGYVMHDKPEKYKQIFWISTGPLIINSVLAIFLGYFTTLTQPESPLYYLIFWVAISLGMHAFPSDHDAKNIFNEGKKIIKNGGSNLHYLAYPFYGLIWIANKLRFIWFDLWYAITLVSLGSLTF
ncbi:MAG: AN1-type Zinc finger protein [Candidatus Magasanikbacteria bacterium GW2011_GWA2_37_8]|uniref:AN1-type Zinc finger protein n=1 Tax=Candidatus Magasanikbacteria bacterium GW2011_GWA2_37_8 TaxID=1619036 RepID=A0A0G0HRV2_9BACT|nr:MAG: AN1-type Zinc finger protein [Candidatus Magasanikbacteria bacterium GW2011_GWA2_37_8]